MRFKTTTLTITLTALLIGATPWVSAAADEKQDTMATVTSGQFSPYVDAEGTISRPPDFRDEWIHIGSWFVREDDQASGPGVHDVYAEPSAVEGFRKTGQWPDGTTLVKEISGIREGQKTTGFAQWAGEAGVWFVMVRDRQNRFPRTKPGAKAGDGRCSQKTAQRPPPLQTGKAKALITASVATFRLKTRNGSLSKATRLFVILPTTQNNASN